MTQQPNSAPTSPKPRLDHNAEWDAPDGPETQPKVWSVALVDCRCA